METNEEEIEIPNPENILRGFCHPYTGLTHIMTDEDRHA
jgi:hypothetical protein